MELETTVARATHPPILFITCPGGGGHLWTELNPRWYSDSTFTPRYEKWCPEHQLERQKTISRKLSTAASNRFRDVPPPDLPAKRVCTNPDPKSHPAGANMRAGKFYRRWYHRADGTSYLVLDSRCKQCRREETNQRRIDHKDDPAWQAKDRERIAAQVQKRKAARRALRNEHDKRLEFGPFREWLKDRPTDELAKLSLGAGLDVGTLQHYMLANGTKSHVSLSVVDKVGISAGVPGLLNELYPVA